MKKLTHKQQSILNYKIQLKNQAKADFVTTITNLSKEKNKLKYLQSQCVKNRNKSVKLFTFDIVKLKTQQKESSLKIYRIYK